MKLFRNRTILGVVCITLSLLICFAVTPLFNAGVSHKTSIVRVKSEIRAGAQIAKSQELKYVEVVGVTTSTGEDADTDKTSSSGGTAADDEKNLPSAVTLLATPEQSTILAGLETDGKLQLSLVYRGSKGNAQKFLNAQDKALKAEYPNTSGAALTASSADSSSDASSSEGGN